MAIDPVRPNVVHQLLRCSFLQKNKKDLFSTIENILHMKKEMQVEFKFVNFELNFFLGF